MKTKHFDKKLVLNKKTIAHLGSDELNAVNGGLSANTTCPEVCMILSKPTCPGLTTCPLTGFPRCFECR
jgi:hypothetical protein